MLPAARLRARIALLLVSSVLSLALVEAGLWLLELSAHSDELRRAFEEPDLPPAGATVTLGEMLRPSPHPLLVYETKGGLDVRFRGARVETNRLGWREALFPEAKAPNEIRVIGIGDSFMFGWAVEEQERYMDVLEAELRARRPSRDWNVLVFAAPGYNFVMELEVLERYALAYDPDLILYGFSGNDLCLPNFVGRPPPPFARHSRVLELLRASPAIGAAAELLVRDDVVGHVPEQAGFSERFCTESTVPPEYRPLVGRENFEGALFAFAALAARIGVPAVMFSHKWRGAYNASRVPDQLLFLDAADDFARHLADRPGADPIESDLVIGPHDAHPSVLGHALIGRSIYHQLETAGVWDALESGPPRAPSE